MPIDPSAEFGNAVSSIQTLRQLCDRYNTSLDVASLVQWMLQFNAAAAKGVASFNSLVAELTTAELNDLVKTRIRPAPSDVPALVGALQALSGQVWQAYRAGFSGAAFTLTSDGIAPVTATVDLTTEVAALRAALAQVTPT